MLLFTSESKKWSLEYLNKKFRNKLNNNYSKIFIDRDQLKIIDKNNLEKFKNYNLLNEKEIKSYLISKGFKIIKPENFSLKDQIKNIF